MISPFISRKKTSFFSFFFLIIISLFSQKNDKVFYDGLIEEYLVPGLSVAVIKDGKLNFLSHHGVRANDTKKSIDNNTVFAAASLSKPCFAYGVMKLVESGILNLDKPLYQYMDYKDLSHDERYKKITTRMILSHSSGLPNWRRGELNLKHDPGTTFQYSGEGYVFLSKIIEHLLQKPIHAIMDELVFQPLGMNHSSFIWKKEFESNFASPHDYTGHTKPNSRTTKTIIASSLLTTANDYSKLILALLNKGELKKNTLKKIFSPQIKINDAVSWGLGWGLQSTKKGKAFWQWGDNGTFKAFALVYPKQKEGFVFFANSFNGLKVVPSLIKHLYNDESPAFKMLRYKTSTISDQKLILDILNKGYEKSILDFLIPEKNTIDSSLINENQIDFVAMQLIWRKRYKDAEKLLLLKAVSFPKSFKAQKKYADFSVRIGNKSIAKEYYHKALLLKPENTIVQGILNQLGDVLPEGNVTFYLKDFLFASSVRVSGSFNNWSSSSLPMVKRNGVWECRIQLKPGEYQYNFVVDGVTILDTSNKEVIAVNGGMSSVLFIKK